ncbi:MAG: hypothetical protein WC901_03490 [Candidatus Margulisiibacteriota bacterium]
MSNVTRLKLTDAERALRWVGAWTPKMRQAGFRFDPQTRHLDERDAVNFVQAVMTPGFMSDAYVPRRLRPHQNANLHDQVATLAREGKAFTIRLGQRAFDMGSSFDLRAMVDRFHKPLSPHITAELLRDSPLMTAFIGCPAVAVIGAQAFPTFRLTPLDDTTHNIYSAPGFMPGTIETTWQDAYLDRSGKNLLARHNGFTAEIDQRHAFNRIFAEHGLYGYQVEMCDFDPLTALGGMGMSNIAVFAAMLMANILTNSGKDEGQIFAEGAYVENSRLSGLTGFQEVIQTLFGGSGILVYAPGYYGGIGRQLLAPGHAAQVEDQMRLILFNRVTGEKRQPVNEWWTIQAETPEFHTVFQRMLETSWDREIIPFLYASAGGTPIDMDQVRRGYLEHAWSRFLLCQQYFGNPAERNFILGQRARGNAVFPLGEGSNGSTKLYVGGPNHDEEAFGQTFPVLDRAAANRALATSATLTTGRVPFEMLKERYQLGDGFQALHDGKAVPASLITIIE